MVEGTRLLNGQTLIASRGFESHRFRHYNKYCMKRIVAYGCSYTAGAELLDHKLPIYKHKSRLKIPQWYRLIEKKNLTSKYKELDEQAKYLAWPAQIAKTLNLDIVNNGVKGGSNSLSVWKLMHDIELNRINNDDLVLVGLTTLQRDIDFVSPRQGHPPPSFVLPNRPDLVKFYSHELLVWKFIQDLTMLQQIKQQLNNRLFLVCMMHPSDYNDPNSGILNQKLYSQMLEKIFKSDLFLDSNLSLIYPGVQYHEHKHPTIDAHIRLSSGLSRILSQKIKNNKY